MSKGHRALLEQDDWLSNRARDKNRRVVAYDTTFLPFAKTPLVTLFLSQALYWQTRMGAGEWWWKTRESWMQELGFSRRNVESCRTALRKLGLLEERRGGVKGVTFYRVVVTKVMALMETPIREAKGGCVPSKDVSMGGCVPSPAKASSSIIDDLDKDLGEAAASRGEKKPRQSGLKAGQLGKKEGRGKKEEKDARLRGLHRDTKSKQKTYADASETVADASETVAQRAARKALEAHGRSGQTHPDDAFERALASNRGSASRRRRKPKDPFESACNEGKEDELKHDPVRKAVAQRSTAPMPHEGAGFDAWSDYAQDRICRPARHGGGVKQTKDWNGVDLDRYLGILIDSVLTAPKHDSRGKTRKHAADFVRDLTAIRAREFVDYALDSWTALSVLLKIDAPAPSIAIISGYLESIKAHMAGLSIGKGQGTGADRVSTPEEYADGPATGWGWQE